MTSSLKTMFLLALLSGIILVLGQAMGGSTGLVIALGLALVMNVGSYWYSDKLILRIYKAREVSAADAPMLHRMVEDLAASAGIPKPKVCVVPEDTPNAFATGRNPENGVVAVTEGILRLLSPEELKGVLAHEIGHIRNRDMFIQTVAAVLGTVIMFLASMARWAAIFGGGRSSSSEGGGGGNFLASMLLAVVAPLAASLIQFAISRSREYMADEAGAAFCGNPKALASALGKLSSAAKAKPIHSGSPATAHMFIVNPFTSGGMANLFSTHPPVDERIRRLQAM